MEKYQWTDELSLGISALDDQHKILVSILGQLQDKLMDNMQEREVLQLLRQLQQYAAEHFALEESLMEAVRDSVPNYTAHILEHQKFITEIHSLIMNFVGEGASVAWKLFTFLAEWFLEHIKKTDHTLKDCLQGSPVA